ncbi:hypothetical protein [Nocardia sp. NPDC049149]|uniref:hypothetical protein n=1 Tax=Nocardia sp. NPDC049149 TaxID=3364315 RepID=UPI003718BDE7
MSTYYPLGCDTPELRRAWEHRTAPLAPLLRDILADADLTITVRRYPSSDVAISGGTP